jgi:hypothetical protein
MPVEAKESTSPFILTRLFNPCRCVCASLLPREICRRWSVGGSIGFTEGLADLVRSEKTQRADCLSRHRSLWLPHPGRDVAEHPGFIQLILSARPSGLYRVQMTNTRKAASSEHHRALRACIPSVPKDLSRVITINPRLEPVHVCRTMG